MIELGANFRLSGVPDYLVTLALLAIGAVMIKRALAQVSLPNIPGKIGAQITKALRFGLDMARMLPPALLTLAGLALVANTAPAAWKMIAG